MGPYILLLAGLLLVVTGQMVRQILGLFARLNHAPHEKAVKPLLDNQRPIAKAEPVEAPAATNNKLAA